MSHEWWMTLLGAFIMVVVIMAFAYTLDWHSRGRRRNLRREVHNMINGKPMGMEGIRVWGNVRIPTGVIDEQDRLAWFDKHNLRPAKDNSAYAVNWQRARDTLRYHWISHARTRCPWMLAGKLVGASTLPNPEASPGRGARVSGSISDEFVHNVAMEALYHRYTEAYRAYYEREQWRRLEYTYPQRFPERTTNTTNTVARNQIANDAITTVRLATSATRVPHPYDPPRPAQPQRGAEQEAAQPAAVPNEPAETPGDSLHLQARPAGGVSTLRAAVDELAVVGHGHRMRTWSGDLRYYRGVGEGTDDGGLGQLHRDDEGDH